MNNANFDQLIQTVIYVLIVFVIPSVGYFLSNYLHQAGGNVAEQRKRTIVETLVKAAEQMLQSDPEKRAWVERQLTERFPSISQSEAVALIEAAVLSLHTAIGVSTHDWESQHTPAVVPLDHEVDHPSSESPSFRSDVPPPSRSNPVT